MNRSPAQALLAALLAAALALPAACGGTDPPPPGSPPGAARSDRSEPRTQPPVQPPERPAPEPKGPQAGTRAERPAPAVPEGTRRVHVFVSGRVQGVGFRAFTQNQARQRGLAGFVRNLADGRVEAVLEGPGPRVAEVLEQVKHGPRAASVEKVEATDEPPEGDSGPFEIWY